MYRPNLICSHCGDFTAALTEESFNRIVGQPCGAHVRCGGRVVGGTGSHMGRCEACGARGWFKTCDRVVSECPGVWLDSRGQAGVPTTFPPVMDPEEANLVLIEATRVASGRRPPMPPTSLQNPVRNPPCRIVRIGEDAYDEDLDIEDVADQAGELFRRSEIRPYSYEQFYEACVDPSGRVFGASVLGYAGDAPDGLPCYTFSIVVEDDERRKGIARALAQSIVRSHPRDEFRLEAEVVNPHMETLLKSLGFERDESHTTGLRMKRANPQDRWRPNPYRMWHGTPYGPIRSFSEFASPRAYFTPSAAVAKDYTHGPGIASGRRPAGVTGSTPSIYEVEIDLEPDEVFDTRRHEHQALYEEIRQEIKRRFPNDRDEWIDRDLIRTPSDVPGWSGHYPGYGTGLALIPYLKDRGFAGLLLSEGSQGASLLVFDRPGERAKIIRDVDVGSVKGRSVSGVFNPAEWNPTIPMGDCFRWAYQFQKEHGGTLVHGFVRDPQSRRSFPHAWVVLDGRVWDWQTDALGSDPLTVAKFRRTRRPSDEVEFEDEEAAAIAMLRHGHYGPWSRR